MKIRLTQSVARMDLTRIRPNFWHFKKNTQILGLIRLKLGILGDGIPGMSEIVVKALPAGKPKLLDQVRDDDAA